MADNNFSLNFQKAMETAGLFLTFSGGRMHNVRLMKLMYMADRRCLEEEARTITGDQFYAMQKGPILSTIHNIIRGRDYRTHLWRHYFKEDKHDVVIATDTGTGELCLFEKDIIRSVHRETEGKDVVQLTHTFPEWKKYESLLNAPSPSRRSYPISLQDVLEGIGKPELMAEVEKKIAEDKWYKELIRG
jgi:hypothetical protein